VHHVLISRIELHEIRMRLLRPFETSFGVTRDRRILLVRVSDGTHEGYGEVTAGEGPFYCHETTETAWYILSAFIVPKLLGKTIENPSAFAPFVENIRGHNMAKGGIEAALWDLHARRLEQPLWKLLGGTRQEIESGVSIGIQPSIDRLLGVIRKELRAGYRRIKIKIKPGWDVEVVRQVRQAFPKILLMCDANSAYTLADIDRFRQMDAFDVMMFEQPLHYEDMIDHAELQRNIGTPICLDESIHSADDARKAISIGACRIINIKLGRVGGHAQARAVHDVCRDSGIPVWCGGMLESGIGRAHNVALSSLENFSLPGDVAASKRYWTEDIIEPPVEVSLQGTITQKMDSGIGYRINHTALERATMRWQPFGR
jgi:O-succinylbenzoate synthase